MCWLKDLVKIHQRLTFASNILLELEQINYPSYDFGYAKTSQKQKVFKPIATGKVRDENVNFESNRTSSMSGKIQTKQSLLSPRFSSSHQIPKYHSYLILSYPISILSASHSIFHSFITSLISVYFVVIKKLFFNQYIKKLLK